MHASRYKILFMLEILIGAVVLQTDWQGGAVSPGCSYNDLSCLNGCTLLNTNFGNDFCTGTDDLVFYSPGKLRIFGTFQYLDEHTVKGPGQAGGWDNDPDIFDVNQDGHLDLVVTDESFLDPNDSVWVFLNDGNGNFTQINVDGELESVDEIHENDADNDGDIDLFTVGHSNTDEDVVLFVNTGAGWAKCVICQNANGACDASTPGSGEVEGIYTGDLDGDGDVDIAVTHLGDGALYVFERVPAGTPNSYGCTIPGAGEHYYRKHFVDDPSTGGGWNVVIEDGDGDGDRDIFVTFHNALIFYRNTGGLTFNREIIENFTGKGYYGLDVEDLDGDGDPDVAVSNRSADSVKIFINDGSGAFTLYDKVFIPHPMGVVINDVEEDGDKDIFVASYYDGATPDDSTIYVLVNDGGAFTPVNQSSNITRRSYFGVGSGDLDGDGDADLLVRAGRSGSVPSSREGLYWYSAVLFYADSAKVVSNIVDINGPSNNENWRFDSVIVRGKNLEYLTMYIRNGRNWSQFQSSTWMNINDIASCTTFGTPVDSIKCQLSDLGGSAQDTFSEFIQYRLDLYAHDGNGDSYKEISAIVYDVQFKFNENITPISVRENAGSIEFMGRGYAYVYDVRGRLIRRVRVDGNGRLEKFLRPGIYLVIFKKDSGEVIRRKLLIR